MTHIKVARKIFARRHPRQREEAAQRLLAIERTEQIASVMLDQLVQHLQDIEAAGAAQRIEGGTD